jgi:hypothetical protein
MRGWPIHHHLSPLPGSPHGGAQLSAHKAHIAHATKQSRLRIVISAAVCEARLIFAAAFFVAHCTPRSAWPPATATGLVLFSWIRALIAHGSDLLQSRWRWSPQQAQLLYANLSLVVAPDLWSALPVTSVSFSADSIDWHIPPRPYPSTLCAFLHTIRFGAPWRHALHFFADLPLRHFSEDGRIFTTPNLLAPLGRRRGPGSGSAPSGLVGEVEVA